LPSHFPVPVSPLPFLSLTSSPLFCKTLPKRDPCHVHSQGRHKLRPSLFFSFFSTPWFVFNRELPPCFFEGHFLEIRRTLPFTPLDLWMCRFSRVHPVPCFFFLSSLLSPNKPPKLNSPSFLPIFFSFQPAHGNLSPPPVLGPHNFFLVDRWLFVRSFFPVAFPPRSRSRFPPPPLRPTVFSF